MDKNTTLLEPNSKTQKTQTAKSDSHFRSFGIRMTCPYAIPISTPNFLHNQTTPPPLNPHPQLEGWVPEMYRLFQTPPIAHAERSTCHPHELPKH